MLHFNDLSLRRGPRLLMEKVNMIVHQGQRVGITGANGSGKSSLMALMLGELDPDSGDFSQPERLKIAHVAQETPALERAAIEYVMDGDTELRSIQAELAQAEAEENGQHQAELHAKLDTIDAYSATSRAGQLMSGLGFSTAEEAHSVRQFSGGWRMRLNLGKALMCRSDLLLLDEPTNHLDLDAVIWLQEWLRSYRGTLILISHDRDFLDEVVTQVAHIEHKKVTLYNGNYTAYEHYRIEQLQQQQAAYEKQQREIKHVRSFVDRFRAKATKAKQAQSRLKTLARMELIAQAHVDSPFSFGFGKPKKLPRPLLQMEQVAVGYDNTPLLESINLTLSPGDRVGLLGANGAGKSTFIKLLAQTLDSLSGRYDRAKDLKIGYFAQHQLEQLQCDESPFQHMQQLAKREPEQSVRDYLGSFGFHGERVDEKVKIFSGGEKARLVLALLIYQRPNLLLLDEPTNHLDIEMRTALSIALQEYEGAMIIVSHDRHMLRSTCDNFLIVADHKVELFDGDLDDYRHWLTMRQTSLKVSNKQSLTTNNSQSKKQRRQHEAERRKQLQPLTHEVKRVERALEKTNNELAQIEQRLLAADLYCDEAKDELKKLLAQQSRLKTTHDETEEAWMLALEALEEAEQQLGETRVC